MQPRLASFLCLCLTVGSAHSRVVAQAVERALPRVCQNAYGTSTAFGTPPSSFRAQYWYSAANLPVGWPVSEIGIRVRRNFPASAQVRDIEILVDNSTVTFGGFSGTFANNLSAGTTTFFANRSVNFPAAPPNNDPDVAATWFPGDSVFVFTGPNLIVDFRGGSNGGAGTVRNDGVLTQAPANPALNLSGSPSCGGTLSGSYTGGVVDLLASGLLPGSVATFQVGFENVTLGGLRLPLDLGLIGIPGCHLATVPFVSAQVPVTAGGTAQLSIPIAASATSTTMFSSQVIHTSAIVPTSLTDLLTTNAVNSAVGVSGLCNTVFAGSSSAVSATSGPNPVNAAIAILLR